MGEYINIFAGQECDPFIFTGHEAETTLNFSDLLEQLRP